MYFVYFFSTFALLNYTKNHYNYVFVFFFVFNLLLGILLLLSNAFNSLNRAAALNNIRVLCWLIATYVTNTYRVPTRLFVVGGSELKSAEGTTQGDPLAMSMYAISLQPLISLLHNRSTAKQCWFADDATGAGPLEEVKQWWDELREAGPPLGYYPNSKKCTTHHSYTHYYSSRRYYVHYNT